MNSNDKKSIVMMESDELKQLVSEVKETVATGFDVNQTSAKQSVFSTTDLWYIRKMKKGIERRRMFIL